MTPDGPIEVACAAKGDYVRHSAVMLRSVLLQSAPRPVRVHYLTDDAGERELPVLGEFVASLDGVLHPLVVAEDDVRGLPVQAEFTSAMWFRILLPDLLPDLQRVLYLDVDTLAMDDLGPLWDTGLDGCYLAAVRNVFQHNHKHRPADLGLPPAQPYFNSGVLLMNLEEMRRRDATQRLRECALTHGDGLEWPDQDALNLVLGSHRADLHPRWNCMNSVLSFKDARSVFGRRRVRQARRSPGIRHFEGPAHNKPWDPRSLSPGRDQWLAHRSYTPWPAG